MKKLLAFVLTLVVLVTAFCACGAKAVASITIDEGLIREYNINDTPDFSGIKATVKYNDESTKSVTADDLTFGELDTSSAGTKQLTITYGGYTITVDIIVRGANANAKKVTSITVTEGIESAYALGSTPDFSGIKATVGYNDGTTASVTASDLTIGTVDTATAGEKKLTITYDGFTTEVKVVVLPPVTVTGITVTEGIAAEYEFGSTPDFTGIKATITYSDGTTENVTYADLTIGTLDTTVAGEKDLAITYKGYTKYVDVTVLAEVVITEIVITEGLDEEYDVNETPDFSGIKATVKYSNGTTLDVTAEDLTIGSIDTATAGEKILEVTYDGFTETFTVSVIDYITGITVTEGVAAEYEFGSTPDFTGIKATVSYSDGTTEDVTYADLTVGTIDTSVAGKQNLKIEYDGFVKYVSVTVLPPVTVVDITITEGLKSEYKVGETPDFSGIKATITYSNNTTAEVTAEDLTIGTLDTATAGEKKLSITYDGFEKGFKVTVVVPAHITGITVTEGIEESYEFESTPDFSGIKATVTYSDGTTKYVTFKDLTVGTLDTTVAGEKDLAITYEGYTVYVDVVVNEPAPEFEITGASLPKSITNRNEYKKKFRDQNKGYIVGDDNPFTLALIITAFDMNDDLVSGLDYIGSSIVYLVTEKGEEIVGEEYVVIDELKHTYDFTEKAIGKTFKIVTRPTEGIEDDMIDDVTSELVVNIVDGYNVTNAKELNLITNTNSDINDDSSDDQLDNVNAFLKNNGITRPENLKAVIIHDDLVVTMNDLPEGYFVTYTKDGVTKTELYDWTSIYNRTLTADEPTFSIFGNYYTIYSYELPCTVAYGYGNQDDDYSNSELFRFQLDESLIKDGADLTPYYASMDDLNVVDSHPNTNLESESERSKRGLIGIKSTQITLNVTNTNVEKFFNSMIVDYDYSNVTLNKVTFYNAWQGHLYLWADNSTNQSKDEAPWASHKPLTLTIIDSSLTKCGGPVILAQNANADFACNAKSGIVTNIDKSSVLESWVTGEEEWFNATGVKPLAIQIKMLSQILTLTGANYGKNAGFVKVDGNQTYINLAYVNMLAGSEVILGGADIDGKVIIDNKVVLNQNDGENDIVDQYANTVGQAMGAVPPVFQSSAGGTCFGNPEGDQAGCYKIDFATLMEYIQSGVDPATAFRGALGIADANCFEGDYITLYYNGMAILFTYFN